MINEIRTAIQVGNSIAVTLPKSFVNAGEKIRVVKSNGFITLQKYYKSAGRRLATNEEVVRKFEELEKRYGKLYDDLARIP